MSFSVRPTWITPSPSCCRNTSRPRSLRNPKHLTNGFDEELEQREDHATDQVHDDEAAAYQALLNQDYEQVEPKGVDGQALLFRGKAECGTRATSRIPFASSMRCWRARRRSATTRGGSEVNKLKPVDSEPVG